jgi:hypothetical protein
MDWLSAWWCFLESKTVCDMMIDNHTIPTLPSQYIKNTSIRNHRCEGNPEHRDGCWGAFERKATQVWSPFHACKYRCYAQGIDQLTPGIMANNVRTVSCQKSDEVMNRRWSIGIAILRKQGTDDVLNVGSSVRRASDQKAPYFSSKATAHGLQQTLLYMSWLSAYGEKWTMLQIEEPS